ncbi:unnamed protein product [Caenorhabditis nigoni]
MMTRSQTHRTFGGLSQSPLRQVTFANTPVVIQQTSTPEVVNARTVKNRLVTPRFRATMDTGVNPSLANYGLRSRGVSHMVLLLALFMIGFLFSDNTEICEYARKEENKLFGLPAVSIDVRVIINFKHSTCMAKEYTYDLDSYIYAPVASFFNYLIGPWHELLQPYGLLYDGLTTWLCIEC